MKGLIIYKSKYGATKQYASWLSEKLNMPMLTVDDLMEEQLEQQDLLVIGSSVYIGKLLIASWMKENISLLVGKKIFFYLVSGTPPDQIDKLQEYIRKGIPGNLRENLNVYFLHGKMKLDELKWKDLFMLRMGAWLTKDPVEKRKMLSEYDDVYPKNLEPLIKDVEEYVSSGGDNYAKNESVALTEYF